jgi:hypothetical protein
MSFMLAAVSMPSGLLARRILPVATGVKRMPSDAVTLASSPSGEPAQRTLTAVSDSASLACRARSVVSAG